MNVEELRDYCIKKQKVSESFPFDADTLVFKVMGKMFALLPLEKSSIVVLKCNPNKAIELRELYSEIQGAYHMNKTHWNQIVIDGDVPVKLILELVDHSYDLVVSKLPKKDRESL